MFEMRCEYNASFRPKMTEHGSHIVDSLASVSLTLDLSPF